MNRSRRLLFWAVLVVGTVGVAEFLVRVALDPPGLLAPGDDARLMRPREPMGYALAPDARGHHTADGRQVPIRINAWGFRDGSFDSAIAAPSRLLGVGDSFTLGLGVDSADPWPQQLERLLRRRTSASLRVVNAGVPGYSPRQMRQTMEAVMPELRPQVVVFAAAGENFRRMNDPYVLVDGYLVRRSAVADLRFSGERAYASPIVRWDWLHDADLWMNQHFQLGAQALSAVFRLYGWLTGPVPGVDVGAAEISPDTAAARLRSTLEEIARADSVARQGGATLVVLLVNSQERDGRFRQEQWAYNRLLRQFCEERGIRVVDPLPTLDSLAAGRPVFRTPDDYHWTPAAHAVAAEELARVLMSRGLVAVSPSPEVR